MKAHRLFVRSAVVVTILVALALAGYFGARFLMPEIVVVNHGLDLIEEVSVSLPSSRVVFGPILTGEQSTIHYDSKQADGTYRVIVSTADGSRVSIECGYVTNSELGKGLRITVLPGLNVQCEEYRKY